MENILKDSEEKFRILIENSSDVIAILSEDLIFSFISPSSERILGYSADDILGHHIDNFLADVTRDSVVNALAKSLKKPGEKIILDEGNWNHATIKDDLVFEMSIVNLVHDSSVRGIVINCHDITKRKNTEDQLLNTNFELDSFVYKASHDLKAPLRSIMGLIKLAQKESNAEAKHDYLNMMSKSVCSLDHFIKDLTQFSRNSRLGVETSLIDFNKIVDEALANLQFVEFADKIEVRRSIESSCEFYSDAIRVGAILNNLLSNAYKYHRFEDNPFISVSIQVNSDAVLITVADNGQGIDGRYLDKIFEMFYRASESTYGSGLGLYIAQSAAVKLGGNITVESVVDKGSVFTVHLPNLIND